MKIHHKTSSELRRKVNDIQFDDNTAYLEPVINEILDAYEDCEKKSIEPKAKTKHSEHSAKSRRILAALEASDWPLTGAELSRIGSGKEHGFCLSFSKEISRLRALNHHVVIVKTERVNGQTVNYYKLNPVSVE